MPVDAWPQVKSTAGWRPAPAGSQRIAETRKPGRLAKATRSKRRPWNSPPPSVRASSGVFRGRDRDVAVMAPVGAPVRIFPLRSPDPGQDQCEQNQAGNDDDIDFHLGLLSAETARLQLEKGWLKAYHPLLLYR